MRLGPDAETLLRVVDPFASLRSWSERPLPAMGAADERTRFRNMLAFPFNPE
jgi:hypothetical protein